MNRKSTPSTKAAQDFEQVVPLFTALSDASRLQLVEQLSREGPQSISVLSKHTAITRQAVTKHLQVLEEAKLASSWRDGRKRIFELRPEQLTTAHRHLDQIARQWDETLGRLKTYVEKERKPEQELRSEEK